MEGIPYTGRTTGKYIVFYQGGPIDHWTHVLSTVAQSISGREYNTVCTTVMALAHFRMLNNELLNNDTYVVPEQAPIIILDGK